MDEIRRIPELVHAPHLVNIVAGGKTPTLNRDAAAGLGFSLLLYANAALQGAILGMQKAFASLQQHGSIDEASGLLTTFAERQRLVGKPTFDAMDQRYAATEASV